MAIRARRAGRTRWWRRNRTTLDSALLARPGNDEIQLDLFLDYASNVALYPKFQEYFRTKRPSLLAVWGKNDPFFLPPGAEAFKRDNPNAEVISSTPATSRSRRTIKKSLVLFEISWVASSR